MIRKKLNLKDIRENINGSKMLIGGDNDKESNSGYYESIARSHLYLNEYDLFLENANIAESLIKEYIKEKESKKDEETRKNDDLLNFVKFQYASYLTLSQKYDKAREVLEELRVLDERIIAGDENLKITFDRDSYRYYLGEIYLLLGEYEKILDVYKPLIENEKEKFSKLSWTYQMAYIIVNNDKEKLDIFYEEVLKGLRGWKPYEISNVIVPWDYYEMLMKYMGEPNKIDELAEYLAKGTVKENKKEEQKLNTGYYALTIVEREVKGCDIKVSKRISEEKFEDVFEEISSEDFDDFESLFERIKEEKFKISEIEMNTDILVVDNNCYEIIVDSVCEEVDIEEKYELVKDYDFSEYITKSKARKQHEVHMGYEETLTHKFIIHLPNGEEKINELAAYLSICSFYEFEGIEKVINEKGYTINKMIKNIDRELSYVILETWNYIE